MNLAQIATTYPQYFDGLTQEQINTTDLNEATDLILNHVLTKAKGLGSKEVHEAYTASLYELKSEIGDEAFETFKNGKGASRTKDLFAKILNKHSKDLEAKNTESESIRKSFELEYESKFNARLKEEIDKINLDVNGKLNAKDLEIKQERFVNKMLSYWKGLDVLDVFKTGDRAEREVTSEYNSYCKKNDYETDEDGNLKKGGNFVYIDGNKKTYKEALTEISKHQDYTPTTQKKGTILNTTNSQADGSKFVRSKPI